MLIVFVVFSLLIAGFPSPVSAQEGSGGDYQLVHRSLEFDPGEPQLPSVTQSLASEHHCRFGDKKATDCLGRVVTRRNSTNKTGLRALMHNLWFIREITILHN